MNWIKTTGRLPDKAGEYLCTCRWRDGEEFYVSELEYGPVCESWKGSPRVFPNGCGFGETWNDGIDNVEEVIAWMPLPEPYQEEQKGENET